MFKRVIRTQYGFLTPDGSWLTHSWVLAKILPITRSLAFFSRFLTGSCWVNNDPPPPLQNFKILIFNMLLNLMRWYGLCYIGQW